MRKFKRRIELISHKIHVEFRYHLRILKNNRISRKRKVKYLIRIITRRCEGRGNICNGGWAYLQHSNCAYEDELSNYNYCCKDCHEQIDSYYQERWDEYNSGRL